MIPLMNLRLVLRAPYINICGEQERMDQIVPRLFSGENGQSPRSAVQLHWTQAGTSWDKLTTARSRSPERRCSALPWAGMGYH